MGRLCYKYTSGKYGMYSWLCKRRVSTVWTVYQWKNRESFKVVLLESTYHYT